MLPKRLRLFAGPNGSGKTTILERIPKELNFKKPYFLIGTLVIWQ
jgi:predicted ABC-type ATPase